MKPTFQVSAAMLAIALTGLLWLANPGRGGVAFADTLAKVADVRSVSYRIEMHGRDRINFMQTTVAAQPPRIRSIVEPQGLVSIVDINAGKMLMLDPRHKTAQVTVFTGMAKVSGVENMLEWFKDFDSRDFDRLGEKSIKGQTAIGFRQKSAQPDAMQRTVWVDQQTQLPVEVDLDMQDKSQVISDIQWDVPLTDDMFSLTPPAGYTTQTIQASALPPSEKDLTDALGSLARLNDGNFPDTFDLVGLRTAAMHYARTLRAAAAANGSAPQPGAKAVISPEDRQAMVDQFSRITRGIMFSGNPLNGSDWHYAGKGVAKGAVGSPIFWYLPRGAMMYRVIDADLNIVDVPADQLPNVPSVILGPPNMP